MLKNHLCKLRMKSLKSTRTHLRITILPSNQQYNQVKYKQKITQQLKGKSVTVNKSPNPSNRLSQVQSMKQLQSVEHGLKPASKYTSKQNSPKLSKNYITGKQQYILYVKNPIADSRTGRTKNDSQLEIDSSLLIKLQNENAKMREKIKELSAQVEQALDKASKNLAKKGRAKSPQDNSMVRDKELMNQEQQIAQLKKELNSYKIRYDADANIENYLAMQNKLVDSERKNAELLREIQALKNVQHEQSKALERLSQKDVVASTTKSLTDEVRLANGRIRELEERKLKDEQLNKKQFDHIIKLEEKIKELREQISSSNKNNPMAQLKQSQIPQDKDLEKLADELQSKLMQAERQREIAEKARDQEVKKSKKMTKQLQDQINQLQTQLEASQRQIREKEQEGRLASSKLREIQKNIKHGQLTPLVRMGSPVGPDNETIEDKDLQRNKLQSDRNAKQYTALSNKNSETNLVNVKQTQQRNKSMNRNSTEVNLKPVDKKGLPSQINTDDESQARKGGKGSQSTKNLKISVNNNLKQDIHSHLVDTQDDTTLPSETSSRRLQSHQPKIKGNQNIKNVLSNSRSDIEDQSEMRQSDSTINNKTPSIINRKQNLRSSKGSIDKSKDKFQSRLREEDEDEQDSDEN
ncbi:UNKNOWN [Stylonychia lemnae]|uniref:Lebercilin domain-containing protein n=1 Tax=Stylonychia lemnae TaxID=5949 RepID=A0A078BEK0_STYLE|nr:UNKNOWN [Stylonychia lemnae]|eukprot:CDW91577.1 UNKNOWN [Stylonychia lemnae]